MSFKLFTDRKDNLAYRVQIAAKYSGVNVELVQDSSAASKAAVAKLPVLETKDGVLFEANAIARFVARQSKGHLFGASPFEEALVENWIDFSVHEIELPAAVWVFPVQGRIPANPVAVQRAKADLRKVLEALDKHLLTRTFLVGQRLTLADIVVSMSLYHCFELVFDTTFRKSFQNLNRWYLTCVNQAEFKAVLGDVKLAEKEAAPGERPAEATHAKKDKKEEKEDKKDKKEKKEEKEDKKDKKEKKEEKEDKKDKKDKKEEKEDKKDKKEKKEEKKEDKPKKEEKPKEEKKEKPKKKDDDEEEADEFAEEPKKKNPLDNLPPSKFVMDEWKRFYSNNETTDSIPWFFERYDPAGYSLWVADYKYNEENKVAFMVSNLLGGFIQRLDALRKYAFGSLVIFGDAAPFEISCVWLFRGTEIPEDMKLCDDSELYTWRKLDIANAADKQIVADYWAWEGKFGANRKFNSGKIFK